MRRTNVAQLPLNPHAACQIPRLKPLSHATCRKLLLTAVHSPNQRTTALEIHRDSAAVIADARAHHSGAIRAAKNAEQPARLNVPDANRAVFRGSENETSIW